MKTLFENITPYFGVRIVEHNGRKFRIYLEKSQSDPCVRIGGDWYHSLSVMSADGEFKQITDAREIGSFVTHKSCERDFEGHFETLCEDFGKYIEKVY